MGKALPKQWPTDWPDRVSIQPVEEYLAKRGKPPLTEEQRQLLEMLRDEAKRINLPPYISISLRSCINKIGKSSEILDLMGIPNLKATSLKKQKRIWAAERKEQGLAPLGRTVPGWQVKLMNPRDDELQKPRKPKKPKKPAVRYISPEKMAAAREKIS